MQEWFEDWFDSPYYHILYKQRSEDEASEFVEKLVTYFDLTSPTTLLDLACGKGRHSLAFAKHGLDVTGVDLSKNSIEYASQFENDHLHFYVHDMRRTFRSNYYDIVCNLFTSFGYFKTKHDNSLAAKSMFDAVKKNGHVLIDFVNRNFAIQNIEAKREEIVQHDQIKFVIKRHYTKSRLTKEIAIYDDTKELHFEESLSSFTLTEMKDLFESVGFIHSKSFGNYQLDDYNETSSPRMILIFTK